MSNKLWIEQTHEEYDERAARDTYTDDHYTGRAKAKAEAKARALTDRVLKDQATGEIKNVDMSSNTIYLYRRAQGETKEAYIERVMLSKYPNVHANIVDGFTGMVQAVDHKADRDLSVFGDIEDTTSFAYQLWSNSDGSGTNYTTMYSRACNMFSNFSRVWYLVEDSSYVWLDSRDVTNWIYDEFGNLSDVIVKEMIDGREGIKDEYPDPEDRVRYVHYHQEGYDRYRISKDETGSRIAVLLEDESGTWDFPHLNEKGETVLPIGFVDIGVDRNPGYKMAQDANYLYNLLSDTRNTLRIANYHKLRGKDVTDDEFDRSRVSLQQGSNLLQGDWDYISPSIENALGAYEIYNHERTAFFVTNHQRYNDAAKETTATEARQDDQRGPQAWLNVLTTALDELELQVLFLLSQKQFPTDQSKWKEATVKRSRDFKPVDAESRASKLQNRYIEGLVDIGETGRINVHKEIASLDGVVYEEDELEQVLSDQETERKQREAEERELNEINNLINQA